MPEEPKDLPVARHMMDPTIPEEPALVADAEITVADILNYLAPALYEQPDLPGVAVREEGQIVGLITRQRLLGLWGDESVRKLVELAGLSLDRPRYFVCPEGDYEELVIFYDPDDPPMCETHKIPLIEED